MKIITDENKIEEILNRGTEDIIDRDSLKKKLMSGKRLNIKFGIDPTGPKIHLGRASVLMKLRDFQDLGHKIIFIIGNFTALIGDASDKDSIRKPLTEKEIKENVKHYLKQIGMILDLSKIEVKYNKDWFGKMKTIDIIKLSMNFTAQQMIQRRNFKERWDSEKPIGVHELLYPLLQGYDSVVLKSDLELGGFDQLFNLKAGRELQKTFNQEPQDVMTVKMLYGLDGRKMSTSWGNVINILDEPKDMFGKLMSLQDELVPDYFESCTRIPMVQVNQFKQNLLEKTVNPKELKKILAKEIIAYFYGHKKAEEAEKEFEKVHENKELPTEIEEISINENIIDAQDLLVRIGFANSKSEAKRLIEQNGARIINGNESKNISLGLIEIKKGMIVQAGKRHFKKIV